MRDARHIVGVGKLWSLEVNCGFELRSWKANYWFVGIFVIKKRKSVGWRNRSCHLEAGLYQDCLLLANLSSTERGNLMDSY